MSTAARDNDGDTQMLQTTATTANTILSPPLQTQTLPRNATANANGKRPLNTISNGNEEEGDELLESNDYNTQADKSGSNAEADVDSDMDTQLAAAVAGNTNNTGNTTVASATAAAAGANEAGAGTSVNERQEFAPRVHAASGYTWSRAADEPGAAWLSKKAMDEASRAVESALHREHAIRGKYGDPFEAAEREAAVQKSLAQR